MSTNNSSDIVFNNGSFNEARDSSTDAKIRYLKAALVLSWTYTVLIIVLNIAVIVAIWKYNKRSRLYFLLLNIAIADLLTGLLDAVPLSMERSLARYLGVLDAVWPLGTIACKIQRTVANTACMASNYILAATSVDRALVVCKPMASFRRRGLSLQKSIVVSCWLGSLVSSCWYLYGMDVFTIRGQPVCGLDMIYGKRNLTGIKIYLVLFFLALFVIPFLCIVTSYTFLVIGLSKRAAASSDSAVIGKGTSPLSRVFNRGLPRTKKRSIQLTIGIIVGFLFAWSTFFGFLFRQVFGGIFYNVDILFMTCYFWNSIVNPVAFFIFHRRKARSTSRSLFYSSETKASEINGVEAKLNIKSRNYV